MHDRYSTLVILDKVNFDLCFFVIPNSDINPSERSMLEGSAGYYVGSDDVSEDANFIYCLLTDEPFYDAEGVECDIKKSWSKYYVNKVQLNDHHITHVYQLGVLSD